MGTLITRWHGDHDISWFPIEFKSVPSYMKHTIDKLLILDLLEFNMLTHTTLVSIDVGVLPLKFMR